MESHILLFRPPQRDIIDNLEPSRDCLYRLTVLVCPLEQLPVAISPSLVILQEPSNTQLAELEQRNSHGRKEGRYKHQFQTQVSPIYKCQRQVLKILP